MGDRNEGENLLPELQPDVTTGVWGSQMESVSRYL